MTISNYYGNDVLDYLFGQTAMTSPTGLYMAVSATAFAEAPPHTNEPSAAYGYARVTIPNTKSYWSTASSQSLHNKETIEFSAATNNWGTMAYFAIMDTGTYGSGYPLVTGALNPTRTIYTGDSLKWSSGNLVINVT